MTTRTRNSSKIWKKERTWSHKVQHHPCRWRGRWCLRRSCRWERSPRTTYVANSRATKTWPPLTCTDLREAGFWRPIDLSFSVLRRDGGRHERQHAVLEVDNHMCCIHIYGKKQPLYRQLGETNCSNLFSPRVGHENISASIRRFRFSNHVW
jgi:hypothetical protein